ICGGVTSGGWVRRSRQGGGAPRTRRRFRQGGRGDDPAPQLLRRADRLAGARFHRNGSASNTSAVLSPPPHPGTRHVRDALSVPPRLMRPPTSYRATRKWGGALPPLWTAIVTSVRAHPSRRPSPP